MLSSDHVLYQKLNFHPPIATILWLPPFWGWKVPPGLYSIQNRPEAPDALNSDKRGGRGSGQPFFWQMIFSLLCCRDWQNINHISLQLAISRTRRWFRHCCYKWGSGALWFFHLQMINRYCPAVKKERLMALEIINTKAGYKINCTRSDEGRSLSATLMWCRSVRS